MADIRIKDLATTATTTASDDFMAVDGSTNGTRKMNAAAPAFLTSVTTPSLTSPAATDLTLGTGSFGTALTVASATGNVGIGATPSAWGGPNIPALDIGAYGAIYSATGVIGVGTSANCYYNGTNWIYKSSQYATVYYHGGGNHVWLNSATGVGGNTVSFTQAMTLGPTGTLSISSSTAGSAGAGALVVTGGLSAGNNGNASYFGGAVTAAGNLTVSGSSSVFGAASATAQKVNINGSFGVSNYDYIGNHGLASTVGGIISSNSTSASLRICTLATDTTSDPYINFLTDGASNWSAGIDNSDSDKFLICVASTLGTNNRVEITTAGAIRFNTYGAGTATFDSSGNITSVSDARLKNITGTFTKGLAEIVKLTPKLYTWKPETGLVTDDINATLIAQDLIAAGLSEAVTTYRTVPVMEDDVQSAEDIAAGKPVTQHAKLDANGKAVTKRVDANYSVSDRTVIAALVNAVKELKAEIDALKASK